MSETSENFCSAVVNIPGYTQIRWIYVSGNPLQAIRQLAKSTSYIHILILFDEGGAPSFKGDDGKTETLEVGKCAAEKSLLCIVKTDSGRYRWFKNGRIIGVNTNMKKYRIKKYRYLKIKNIKINDQGVYVCQYNYGDNYVNKTIYLNVFEGRPTFSQVIVI